jgi:Mg2+ and Co2+ transporter CorA
MRIFHLAAEQAVELPSAPDAWPPVLPTSGFLWLSIARPDLEAFSADVQAALLRWTGGQLVDLHIADLLSTQLPSHFDDTSWYDLMVFRRLATAAGVAPPPGDEPQDAAAAVAAARKALESIDTSPIAFAVFDRVLLSVHPADCAVRDFFAQRLIGQVGQVGQAGAAGSAGLVGGPKPRSAVRASTSPADLMLRMCNHMVDSYLDLRRLLTRHLDRLQFDLLDARSRFNDWHLILDARNTLHLLEDLGEDQRGAMQEWIDALDESPPESDPARRREHELLRVRSRDVLEHVERVLSHVRRLEQSSEAAVQMHFSALGQRTNDIMRTLTVLTAIFLPLNLIAGFFGMNFEALPLIHSVAGMWAVSGAMVVVFVALVTYFRRKRYLGSAASR